MISLPLLSFFVAHFTDRITSMPITSVSIPAAQISSGNRKMKRPALDYVKQFGPGILLPSNGSESTPQRRKYTENSFFQFFFIFRIDVCYCYYWQPYVCV